MSNNKKALILAALFFTTIMGGASIGAYCYKNNKIKTLINSELEYENPDLAFDDMFTSDENETSIDFADNAIDKQIATGKDLVLYLNKNNIDLLCINGKWFSKESKEIEIPLSMVDQELYFLKMGEKLNFKQKDDNDTIYTILTTSYDELSKYNINKLLRYNDSYANDLKYSEIYHLV